MSTTSCLSFNRELFLFLLNSSIRKICRTLSDQPTKKTKNHHKIKHLCHLTAAKTILSQKENIHCRNNTRSVGQVQKFIEMRCDGTALLQFTIHLGKDVDMTL